MKQVSVSQGSIGATMRTIAEAVSATVLVRAGKALEEIMAEAPPEIVAQLQGNKDFASGFALGFAYGVGEGKAFDEAITAVVSEMN